MKDSWKITILDVVAVITIPLIGVIGYLNDDKQMLIIESQRATNATLEKVVETLTLFSIKFENHEGRISRAEDDVREIRDTQSNYGKRINKLEGIR